MVLHTVTRLRGVTSPPAPLPHIVTSTVEHDSVEKTLAHLEATGWARVTRVAPQPEGAVTVNDVLAALTPDTVLVSLMLANNETGTLQPVGAIAAAVKKWASQHSSQQQIFIHTDAAQVGMRKGCGGMTSRGGVEHSMFLFASGIGESGGGCQHRARARRLPDHCRPQGRVFDFVILPFWMNHNRITPTMLHSSMDHARVRCMFAASVNQEARLCCPCSLAVVR